MSNYINIDENTSIRDVTFEIWKRVLNNIPYIYKTKGTHSSIRALLSCYGIPNSILNIREYGGPDIDTSAKNYYTFDNQAMALKFYANQSIEIPWHSSSLDRFPSTIEFRFNPVTNLNLVNNSASLVDVDNYFSIQTIHTSAKNGKVKFSIKNSSGSYTEVTSSEIPIYDGSFNSVVLQRETESDIITSQTFNLFVNKYKNNNLTYTATGSLITILSENLEWATNATMSLGGNSQFSNYFSGSLQEFRLWDTSLTDATILSHTKFPQSFIGNSTTSSFDDLLLKYSFDDPRNHYFGSDSSLINEIFYANYSVPFININGWPNEPSFPYSYMSTTFESEATPINIGTSRWSSNKVRIESSSLSGNLNPFKRVEINAYDFQQLDSNLLGIYFSPINLINENIIKSLGTVDIGDLIGDPRDDIEYTTLKALNKMYWKVSSTPTPFGSYVNHIKRYDSSLFDMIKKILPARVKPQFGIVYEQSLLERTKIKQNTITGSLLGYIAEEYFPVNNIIATNYTQTNLNATINITNNITEISTNFENNNIYNILHVISISSASGSYIPFISSVVNFSDNITENQAQTINSSTYQMYSFDTGYNSRHYKNYLGYGTWEKRIKAVGCLNDKNTTYNKQYPVEITNVDAKVLIVRDDGKSKLQVE